MIRWASIAAGITSLIFGAVAIGTPFLVLGGAIQPWARTTGKWLMWLGAFLLTIVVVPVAIGVVIGLGTHPPQFLTVAPHLPLATRIYSRVQRVVIGLLFCAAPCLILWSDASRYKDEMQGLTLKNGPVRLASRRAL